MQYRYRKAGLFSEHTRRKGSSKLSSWSCGRLTERRDGADWAWEGSPWDLSASHSAVCPAQSRWCGRGLPA
ncbi:hypothetical protein EI94DRAFT_1733107 [Lactarius quietus]|nr:hypothetical protein EI94DRAFT_1733107 [Lactarius quietus]